MNLRAAIYARYSSDLQNDRSIEDQIAVCRKYADRQGLKVVAIFIDRATSGASLRGRAGIQQMLAGAAEHKFDVLLIETLSRVGRDEGDRATIRKQLTFDNIQMMTPADGVVTRLTDGIKAIIDSQSLEDLRAMVWRGLSGVVRDGRHAGGRAYGYRPVKRFNAKGEPVRGELEIIEAEAAIVRRIFEEFAGGSSPRQIAARLNADRISAPRGQCWRASTIGGNVGRGHSFLANEIYVGAIVWNRIRMLKHPQTGKRISRPNPIDQWQRVAVPQLRIVPQDLWEAVQARRRARSLLPVQHRRAPRRLLSGLLRCGTCGAGMSIISNDQRGPRVSCSAYHEGRACSHARRYYVARIEARVIDALKAQLGSRAAIALYVRRYNEERRRLAGEASGARARLERQFAQAERDLHRAVDNLVRGRISEAEADAVLPTLRAEHARATEALAAAAEPPRVVTLHPTAVDAYLADLDHLAETIQDHASHGRTESAAAIRRLIDKVTIAAAPAGVQPEIRVSGRLAALTDSDAFPQGTIDRGDKWSSGRANPSNSPLEMIYEFAA